MKEMFASAEHFNSGNLNKWDVSNVVNMQGIFKRSQILIKILPNGMFNAINTREMLSRATDRLINQLGRGMSQV